MFIVPSLRRAGAETQVVDLVNALPADLVEKHLVTFDPGLDQLSRVDADSVRVHIYQRRHKLDFAFVHELAGIVDRQRIDVLHCSLQIALLVGWMVRFLSKRKPRLVAVIHNTLNASAKEGFYDRTLYRRLLHVCDGVAFVCRAQAEYWIEKFPFLEGRSSIVYNGIDLDRFDPVGSRDSGRKLRAGQDIPADAFVFSCIAGFRPEKAHHVLIDAFGRLTGSPYLVLAGGGPLRADIESLAKASGLSGRVRFLGEVNDVRPVLAASNATVLSSHTEAFSMAMLESMSMGVPMVATDIGGLKEAIIPEQTGLLVPVGDPAALAVAMQRLVDAPQLASSLGAEARRMVELRFSKEAMADSTLPLLQGGRSGQGLGVRQA